MIVLAKIFGVILIIFLIWILKEKRKVELWEGRLYKAFILYKLKDEDWKKYIQSLRNIHKNTTFSYEQLITNSVNLILIYKYTNIIEMEQLLGKACIKAQEHNLSLETTLYAIISQFKDGRKSK